MKVLAYDEHANDAGRKIGEYVLLDELLARSDVISLHCPLFPSTQGIINKNTIARMKDGVIIINTSRGPLIVEEDLAAALNPARSTPPDWTWYPPSPSRPITLSWAARTP
jgi:glycerate dehydrogenase